MRWWRRIDSTFVSYLHVLELNSKLESTYRDIQIGPLRSHVWTRDRRDRRDMRTNTLGQRSRTAGPFLGTARTTRAPRDAGGPPFAHQAPDQGRRAPIANRVRMGPRQLSCYRPPDPRILSRRRRILSRGGRTRRPDTHSHSFIIVQHDKL